VTVLCLFEGTVLRGSALHSRRKKEKSLEQLTNILTYQNIAHLPLSSSNIFQILTVMASKPPIKTRKFLSLLLRLSSSILEKRNLFVPEVILSRHVVVGTEFTEAYQRDTRC
jgi:hypothetical protein